MTESELFLIDTNLLVYAFEKEDGLKNKQAKEIVNSCWQGTLNLAVSNQNIAEFVYVSIRKAKLDFSQAETIVSYINGFNGFIKINYSADTVISAVKIAHEFKMSFWDSLLAATMKENGIFKIYTENVKDFRMPWIKAINPMK